MSGARAGRPSAFPAPSWLCLRSNPHPLPHPPPAAPQRGPGCPNGSASRFLYSWTFGKSSLEARLVAHDRIHDVVLALRRVAAHVELDGLLDVHVVRARHRRQAHVLADEALEVLLVDLAETLEARDLAALAALLDRALALVVRVAEVVLLLVAHAEERRLEDVDASVEDQLAVEAHEERRDQHADVESVDVGVGREDDLAVAEMLERLVDVERLDQVEELLVAVEDLLADAERVERLSAEEEHRLVHRVARAAEPILFIVPFFHVLVLLCILFYRAPRKTMF